MKNLIMALLVAAAAAQGAAAQQGPVPVTGENGMGRRQLRRDLAALARGSGFEEAQRAEEDISRHYTPELERILADDAELASLGFSAQDELAAARLERIREEGRAAYLYHALSPACRQGRGRYGRAWYVAVDGASTLISTIERMDCTQDDARAILDAVLRRLPGCVEADQRIELERTAAFVIGAFRLQDRIVLLRGLLASEDWGVRFAALSAAGAFGEDARRILGHIHDWVQNNQNAIPALVSLGTGAPEAETAEAFAALLGDRNPEIVAVALRGLLTLGTAPENARGQVESLFRGPNSRDGELGDLANDAYFRLWPIRQGPGGPVLGSSPKPPVSPPPGGHAQALMRSAGAPTPSAPEPAVPPRDGGS